MAFFIHVHTWDKALTTVRQGGMLTAKTTHFIMQVNALIFIKMHQTNIPFSILVIFRELYSNVLYPPAVAIPFML